ncbi:MAG: DUF1684 domain-containing protein [Acidobacteria bacterium]|nr:DUF1684 domain-containing protein [Acidobacteriota bacterium]
MWRPLLLSLALAGADSHEDSVRAWRSKYEAELRAPYTGWLSVAGLYWLREGANSVGSDAASDFVLPRGPARAGDFLFDGRTVRFRGADGVAKPLRVDVSGEPDVVEIDTMRLIAIERNGSYGLRLRDAQSPLRTRFPGNRWYPIQSRYRVRARFVPHPHKRTINFPDITGRVQKFLSPGVVEFTLHGTKLRLEPVEDDGQLFFVFKDKTAGKTTYGAGRMMYAPLPAAGIVDLDFNVAKNPPCAFTPYATCPLPPRQNILPVAVEAGEMVFEGAH